LGPFQGFKEIRKSIEEIGCLFCHSLAVCSRADLRFLSLRFCGKVIAEST
jgi:hypothetical protein